MFVLRRIVQKVLFWWVRVAENPHHTNFDELKKHKNCIYVLEHQSTSDALVSDHQLQKHGLASIYDELDIPNLSNESRLLTVHSRNSVIRAKKEGINSRLKNLLEFLADNPEQDILLVPVALFWGRASSAKLGAVNALFSSNWTVIGRFKKLFTLIFNGRDTFFEINEPISLREIFDETPDLSIASRKVARILRVHFRRVRTAAIGPDLSHKRVLIEQLLKTDPVRKAISAHSKAKGVPIEKSRKVALKNAQAIAADLSYSTIRMYDIVLTKLWNKIYNGIELHGIEPVRELAKDHEIVYVPCHRSHIDYLLLSYTLHRNGLSVPHIAAGENLNMPIVGGILRRGGAFFIRRKFGGDKLYTAVFNEYIHTVFSRGFPVEYFVEGGRSRTGRMRSPATGTLAMTVRSHLRNSEKPIAFIPVYIGYEKVFESRSYVGELKGKDKKKENLFDLVKSVKHLKNYGRVYLNFGQAISLNSQLEQHKPDWNEATYGPNDRPEWMFSFVDQLAIQVVKRINSAAALNPINMVATALLSTPRQAIESSLLLEQLKLLKSLHQAVPLSEHITLPESRPEEWVEYAVGMGTLQRIPQKLGDLYGLDGQNTITMSYYRNNVQHIFALPSLIAALVVRAEGVAKSALMEQIGMIFPYIQNELFIELSGETLQAKAEQTLAFMAEQGILSIDKQGLVQAPDKASDNNLQLQYLANIMLPTLERYLITLSVLVRLGSGNCSQAILENQSQQMAQRLALLNGLDAPEFFDKALFKSFIQALKTKGVLTLNEEANLAYDERIHNIISQASFVIPDDVWHNIHQIIQRSTQEG
ncbi:glycerol-3-phosphate 1-O-acyltransferase PlsB [Reinekea thalattae]|uniref:Glycerol-3-phosphate acyltransferase n=1 Tax=Reinekea thalattae TaxID=2593301 RepID=A0A5C8ZAD5_9GAMM|nr:glycerol-3-phosphate 1-O-acyltransferase PlsB [Reinekea thalattae]TXR53780.1 glycerol-3-phosphate 1-O-acyltransferase PlsB [Reinekea thalattae]